MGGSSSPLGRCGVRLPGRFALLLIVIESFDQPGEHFRRCLEERLGFRFDDLANVLAQMLNELTHVGLDFPGVMNWITVWSGFHIGVFLLKESGLLTEGFSIGRRFG